MRYWFLEIFSLRMRHLARTSCSNDLNLLFKGTQPEWIGPLTSSEGVWCHISTTQYYCKSNSSNLMMQFSLRAPATAWRQCNVNIKSAGQDMGQVPTRPPAGEVMEREERGWLNKKYSHLDNWKHSQESIWTFNLILNCRENLGCFQLFFLLFWKRKSKMCP